MFIQFFRLLDMIDEPELRIDETPLSLAVEGNHYDAVELLLKNGARLDPNLAYYGDKKMSTILGFE